MRNVGVRPSRRDGLQVGDVAGQAIGFKVVDDTEMDVEVGAVGCDVDVVGVGAGVDAGRGEQGEVIYDGVGVLEASYIDEIVVIDGGVVDSVEVTPADAEVEGQGVWVAAVGVGTIECNQVGAEEWCEDVALVVVLVVEGKGEGGGELFGYLGLVGAVDGLEDVVVHGAELVGADVGSA